MCIQLSGNHSMITMIMSLQAQKIDHSVNQPIHTTKSHHLNGNHLSFTFHSTPLQNGSFSLSTMLHHKIQHHKPLHPNRTTLPPLLSCTASSSHKRVQPKFISWWRRPLSGLQSPPQSPWRRCHQALQD